MTRAFDELYAMECEDSAELVQLGGIRSRAGYRYGFGTFPAALLDKLSACVFCLTRAKQCVFHLEDPEHT